ncbi:MAG: amidohydrolase family protein [Microbacterium sp.]
MNTFAPRIDIHTHYVPYGWPDLQQEFGREDAWPRLRIDSEREAMILLGDAEFRAVDSSCWDATRRLEDMDADGIDMQVLSPTPVFFSYGRRPDEAARISAIFNDLALEISASGEDRLIPFCQVPLQDTDAACRELERSKAMGHRGVEIGNHVGDRDLDDEGIVTFLQHAASLEMPVFVHPWDMTGSPRLNRWMAQWLTGMPAETHLSIIALILGGAFDRLPVSLRIAFAHGGGSFAFWSGRLDNAWRGRNDIINGCELPPSSYLTRFSVDTVVFEERALRLLLDAHGTDRVMVGSDYPYPLGERPVGRVVDEASFLTKVERTALRGGNALRFLGMS